MEVVLLEYFDRQTDQPINDQLTGQQTDRPGQREVSLSMRK